MLIQFVVQGQPVGKGRPKFSSRGSYVHAFTPEKTRAYENEVKWAYKGVVGGGNGFMKGIPINAYMRLYYKIPSGTSRKRRQQMLDGEIRPCVKPDIDNVAKCILDALNGIAFADDNQVCGIWVSKFYDDDPRAEITLTDQ